MPLDLVAGFRFTGIDHEDADNGLICQIARRAQASDEEILEAGPAFQVRFGDGHMRIAYSAELHPWYPT